MADISPATVRSLITDFFSRIDGSGIRTQEDTNKRAMLADDSYSPITKSEILEIAKTHPLMVMPELEGMDIADCDDYALQLKAAATALYRSRAVAAGTACMPPAVGMLFSQDHVVNFFISRDDAGKPVLWVIDTSVKDRPVTSNADDAMSLCGTFPLQWMYI